jgi:hypothetical protein
MKGTVPATASFGGSITFIKVSKNSNPNKGQTSFVSYLFPESISFEEPGEAKLSPLFDEAHPVDDVSDNKQINESPEKKVEGSTEDNLS